MAAGSAADLEPVAQVTAKLQALLQHAQAVRTDAAVKSPLPIVELIPEIDALHESISERYDLTYKYSIVETAARRIFFNLVNSLDISGPEFVEVWNLLDILSVCGDRGASTPELVCWLIEELLDSQTTAGCRIVFDYLESRRERLAAKDFHKKNLVFLRSCNELLRRLSRAEDAIFCGRVFFFLFQTFPLGDKSSVNLRGEFHVENTTKFEVSDGDDMEVDSKPSEAESTPKPETPQPPTKPGAKAVPAKTAKKTPEEVVLSTSELYPIFWRLQQDFSEPIRLFAKDNFATFKKGLQSTLTKFKKTPTVVQTKAAEDHKRDVKRKLGQDGTALNGETEPEDHLVGNYNPKYLTSRDLFDLELSDLAFQRHIMVQALILIDFLLSLTEKAKKKLQVLEATNKSMLYPFTLSADDAKWCETTRKTITDYLQQVPSFGEGRFYHRVVETVLARDKNWVRWKVESCPSIVRDPVSTEQLLEARRGAKEATRLRRLPGFGQMGTMNLSFLDEGQGGGLEALKDPARYTAPSVAEFIEDVKKERLDLDFADEQEKESLENAISNKTWRALRQVRASDLGLLDKVDPAKDVETVFEAPAADEKMEDADAESVLKSEVEDSEPAAGVPEALEMTVTEGEVNGEVKADESVQDATADAEEAKSVEAEGVADS